VCLFEPDFGQVTAVPGVPPERRVSEPARLIDQEQDDLEGVRKADVVKFCRRREGNRCVTCIEGAP
jgi:hypothetical protein